MDREGIKLLVVAGVFLLIGIACLIAVFYLSNYGS